MSSFDREKAHLLLQLADNAFRYTKFLYSDSLVNNGVLLNVNHAHYEERKKAFLHYQKTGFYYSEYEVEDLMDACEPSVDPEPKTTEPLDEKISEFQWMGLYHGQDKFSPAATEAVEGSVYRGPDGKFYIVFLAGDTFLDQVAFLEAQAYPNPILEEAYNFVKNVKETHNVGDEDLVFVGHSVGGLVASILAAAMAFDGFDDNGHYSSSNLLRGTSPISNIPTITFGAPGMGELFTGCRLSLLDVTAVGHVNDNLFIANGMKNHIGNQIMQLDNESGKLKKYLDSEPAIRDAIASYGLGWEFVHRYTGLELALHDPQEEKKELCPCEPCDDCADGHICDPCNCGDKEPWPPKPAPEQGARDPLIIDLNRDGKVSTTAAKRYFDMDANGIAELVSWAASGDGFLVLDRDGDGKITSGREMFGDSTLMSNGKIAVSGFQALADLDTNGDGKIDAQDALFSQLRVWADKDGDGVFGDNEFYALEELGIESIDLKYAQQNVTDENGNRIVRTGKVTWKDGDTSPVSEFLLDRNTRSSDYPEVEVSQYIASLPNLPGSGYLCSLHQAMMRDESWKLADLVEQFSKEKNATARRELLEKIFLKWAEASDLQSSQHEGWLGFLDKYYGGLFVGSPSAQGWRTLERNYETVSLYLYGQLLQETHYADIFDKLDVDWGSWEKTGKISLRIGEALEDIAKKYAEDPAQTKQSIAEFFLVLKSSDLYKYIDEEEITAVSKTVASYGSELADVCRASYLAMQYRIGEFKLPDFAQDPYAANTINGDIHNNILVGGEAGDTLKGGEGTDILIGGKGDDILRGDQGSDIYIWNLGDGNDRIINSTTGSEVDILRIGEGVHPNNVRMEREGNTIRLVIGESGEVLTLATDTSLNVYPWTMMNPMDPRLQIARVEFADGTVWDREYMLARLVDFDGTDANDTIEGSVGNDVLSGGRGDDVLRGGRGSDTYVWNLGDGNDTVEDERLGEDRNILRLKGVAPAGVTLIRDRDSLVLQIETSGERITLPKWYNQYNKDQYRLHGVEFDDGTVWTSEDIENFNVGSQMIMGTDEDDILDGSAGDDFLEGKKGNDLLRGGRGSDTYIWNLGDGNDTITDLVFDNEENSLKFGEGIDSSMLDFRVDGEDLRIIVKATGETITVTGWENVAKYKLARLEFADGSQMTAGEIDEIVGDYVRGGDGEDVLRGSARHKFLVGGKGDDTLYGGQGGCTYVWDAGDGNDTIVNAEFVNLQQAIGDSFLKFGPSVRPEELSMRCIDNNLVITHQGTGETITIREWFLSGRRKLKAFEFDDGTVWNQAKIEALRLKDIVGTPGDDPRIVGFDSDDVLIGLQGDDVLLGGKGNDTYIWNRGDGNDTIDDIEGSNTLEFGEGITPEDIRIGRSGTELFITILGTGTGTIKLPSYFLHGQPMGLARVTFKDGTTWTAWDLDAQLDKTITGGDGDDVLTGYEWDDVISGGRGNDTLRGGKGRDTYIWNLGDGNDRIEDTGSPRNVLQFGEGVYPQDVHLRVNGNDLDVTILKSGEKITIAGWNQVIDGTNWQYSFEFLFADGRIWSPQDIKDNLDRWIIGTNASERLVGTSGDDFIRGHGGDDTLEGGYGNDTYVWNPGDGNDMIIDGAGANVLEIGEGVDPEKIRFLRYGGRMVFEISETGERIAVENWYNYRNFQLQEIRFANGTVWTREDVARKTAGILGTDAADHLIGTDGDDNFFGYGGDDILEGGEGDDTYEWNLGDGNDIIRDTGTKTRIRFGKDVKPVDILLGRDVDGNGILYCTRTNEKIRLEGLTVPFEVLFADGTVWNATQMAKMDVAILGTDGDDTLRNDDYYAGNRGVVFIGGKGDDTVSGTVYDDTFLWNPGDGNDVIEVNNPTDRNNIDVLRLGGGLLPDDVYITRTGENGKDLCLVVKRTKETITIKDWYLPDNVAGRLTRVRFSDGTAWTAEQIDGMRFTYMGTDSNDIIRGYENDNAIYGGKGNDRLYGGSGDDILAGEAGDDRLEGGAGNDIYLWNLGDGNDVIMDSQGDGVLRLGEGIAPSDVTAMLDNGRVILTVGSTGETITLESQLTGIEFADSTVWSWSDVGSFIGGSEILGTDGDDVLEGSLLDDRIIGGKGNDILKGGYGSDTYVWNRGDGNDIISDESGKNVLEFGAGILPDDIIVMSVNKTSLAFAVAGGGRITVEGWLEDENRQLHEVRFADGTVWTADDVRALVSLNVVDGTDEADNPLYGTDMNDIITGKAGDDRMLGGAGNDTYIWNLGDGSDRINDVQGNNILRLGAGIRPENLRVMPGYRDSRDPVQKNSMRPMAIALPSLIMDDSVTLVIGESGERITLENWHEVLQSGSFRVQFEDGSVMTAEDLRAILEPMRAVDGYSIVDGTPYDDVIEGGAGSDSLSGKDGNDILIGNAGDDTLNGDDGDDALYGKDGNDTLSGGRGNDLLDGGRGDDSLNGGPGDDVYVWNRGDGYDTAQDLEGANILRFGEGITLSDITFIRDDDKLQIFVNAGDRNREGRIDVSGWFGGMDEGYCPLQEIRFADGTVLAGEEIAPMTDESVIRGTVRDDYIFGGRSHEATTIIGGPGNDTLHGMPGPETYIWNPGDGDDRIYENGNNNVLRFGAGITPGDIFIRREWDDLIVSVTTAGGGSITFMSWFSEYMDGRFGEIHFENGTVWTSEDLQWMISPPGGATEGNDFLSGGEGDDHLDGLGGNDVIWGNGGNDVLVGGKGDDMLYGGDGNDTYIWNAGDGNDIIEDNQGDNILQLGGVDPESIEIENAGTDLVLIMGDERIVVRNWVTDPKSRLKEIHIGDATIWDRDYVDTRLKEFIDSGEIVGTEGDDILVGRDNRDDTLIGLGGDDILKGGGGNDTYIWSVGHGNDTIEDSQGNNVLRIEGFDAESIRVEDNGTDLILILGDERITVKNWMTDPRSRLKEIHIGDSVVWDSEYINTILKEIIGTEGDDVLEGRNDWDERITGLGGDDLLKGGGGHDTYIWSVGHGNDTIEDNQGNNVLRIEGIDAESIRVEDNGTDLILILGEERITVKNWVTDPQSRLKEIRIGDSVVWDSEHVVSLLNQVVGTEGDDILEGWDNRNDTLIGLGGDDLLKGGGGDDTYLWSVGHGNDTIEDNQGNNVLRIEGIAAESIRVEDNGTDLILILGGECITVKNWVTDPRSRLKEIRIGDSVVWDSEYINAILKEIIGTEGDDVLEGRNDWDERIIGLGGDDLLKGGGGNDTYVWNIGDGNDTIVDNLGNNVLEFGAGITQDSVRIERDRDHLYFVVGDEKIKIDSWFANDSKLYMVRFADGTTWSRNEINALATRVTGTDGEDSLIGWDNTDDTLVGLGGDDVIHVGVGGSDTILWNVGDGNDTIMNASINDRLRLGVNRNSARFERDEEHLYIRIGDERIRVDGWYGKGTRLGIIEFSDGISLRADAVTDLVRYITGTTADEVLQGYDDSDEILEGRGGNDVLRGGGGNDIYIWNIGDGDDRIIDSQGANELRFGHGIYTSFVRVRREGDHLYLDIDGERVAVENWFSDPASQLQAIRFADGKAWSPADVQAQLKLTEELDKDRAIRGTSGDDILLGSSAAERIYGGDGNDRIIGGKGDDKLYGEGGDDTYVWNIGDGNDIILDPKGSNVLEFGDDITPDDIELTRDNRHLYLTHKESGERIKIESWYAGLSNRLAEIRFKDGTVWNADYVDSRFVPLEGTEGNDSILGYDSDDVIFGHGGDDIISGRGGNDTLVGGPGNDRLYGGAGDDVYIWEPGDGSDRINDSEGSNTLRLSEGVLPSAVKVTRDAANLYFHVNDGETICVEDWFRNEKNRLASVEFADGTVWNTLKIEELLDKPTEAIATEGDDILYGTPGDDVIDGLGGNDTIYGGDGDDILVGNRGQDTLYGEGGNDTYAWNLGDGNDLIVDNQGNNRLVFGEGITWTMVRAEPYGTDLILRVGEEYIRITDWFRDEKAQLAEVAFADGTIWTRSDINAKCGVITGTENNDTLYGTAKNDLILGLEGNDRLYGQAGGDSLVGGPGNDYMDGGAGDDSYFWNPGDGNDTIADASGMNVLQIGEGIDPNEVEVQRVGNGLVFMLRQTGERITVANWYSGDNYQLAEVRFANGTVWSKEDVNRMPSMYRGTEQGDYIYASNGPDTIYGYEGNDTILAYGGNDILEGGRGDDSLHGGDGDDTYLWNAGDGSDTIRDNSGVNVLRFGEGIEASNIVLERSGLQNDDIVFVMKDTGERITVAKWFSDNKYQLARIEFADGTVWTRLDVTNMSPMAQGTGGNDILYGTHLNDTLMGYGGDDQLYGYAGRDTLVGGPGNDHLNGGEGDDIYVWNRGDGNDNIIDAYGANVLQFGEGISPSSVELTRIDWSGGNPSYYTGDLVFVMRDTGERIRIYGWYQNERYQFSEIRFADGTIWTREDVNAMHTVFRGTSAKETLFGSNGNDRIIGGAGDDSLYGSYGDDVYVWNLGDGSDRIDDNMGQNVLEFGAGVDPSNLEMSFAGKWETDLQITIGETGEHITILGWRDSRKAQFAEFRFADGTIWTRDELRARFPVIDDRDVDEVIYGTKNDDILNGFGGKDKLYGLEGNDTLNGGDDDDELYGGAGDDALIGGAGNDYMDGEAGNDTYVWKIGHGNDTIYDSSGTNVLEIGEGVDPAKIVIGRNTRDLYLQIAETGETITIKDWYYNARNQMAQIRFADGTVWTANAVNMKTPVLTAPEAGGTVTGFSTDDILVGGPGDDKLYGNAGNDTLEGRGGNDYLDGGPGDDTYVWNLGDGNDTIYDYYDRNVLQLGEGVDPAKVTIGRNSRDLFIIIAETGEKITVKDWYYNARNQLSGIRFADGTIWGQDQLNAMTPVLTLPDTGGTLTGFETDDVLVGGPGKDTLYGYGGNDTLEGGKGEDYLDGGVGNDTYIWNAGDGNDTIYDAYGNNVLKLGDGIDPTKTTISRSSYDLYLLIDETGEKITIKDWYRYAKNQLAEIRFADGTVWTKDQVNAMSPILRGTDSGETINGFTTNDILIGGKGNDTLNGGAGDDTYTWNLGDGNDAITDIAGVNVLKLGEGVDPSKVLVSRNARDLLLTVAETGETITVKDWHYNVKNQLAEIRFADGTVWTKDDVNGVKPTLTGTDGKDTITGFATNDVIEGKKGDDYLDGAAGDDTYIWNVGDGNDTIYDISGNNVLKLGEGVDPSKIVASRSNYDLYLAIGETGEKITLKNWFYYADGRYQKVDIHFANGTIWKPGEINAMPFHLTGTDGNDTINGFSTGDILTGGKGNDTLNGGAGNDTYIWNIGDGNDTITDVSGSNILKLGEGVDPSKVTVSRNSYDLYLTIGETGEKITLKNWFYYVDGRNQTVDVHFADGTIWTSGDINVTPFLLTGTDGNDTINGFNTDDILDGRAGNDTLNGGAGNDTLIGGKGNDTLNGGDGNDTYIWNLGDGNDAIYDVAGDNILELGEGVDPSKVVISRNARDLYLKIGETGEIITVRDWYYNGKAQALTIRFADGTAWTKDDVNGVMPSFVGTDGNDTLYGFETADVLQGGAGNDTLYGRAGDDVLRGGEGNDRLYGEAGDDTLDGGTGDDTLEGGAGNDTYIWNPGDGNDTITDNQGSNVLQFGEGVDPSKIEISRVGNNLLLLNMETGEKITLTNWYYSASYQTFGIEFANGTAWTKEQLNGMSPVLRGTDANDTINGFATDDTLIGGKGNDTLNGGAGNDIYIWNPGDGNDIITDTQGSNLLKFGEGVDPSKVEISRSGNNLLLVNLETGEKITLANWYYSASYQTFGVEFADGTVWTKEQINATMPILRGTDAAETINGFATNDVIFGGGGNDTINAGAGNDILIGGTGNDVLNGDAGDDTYIWNIGDGNDTIYDYQGSNVLEVGEGIDPTAVTATRDGRNLVITMETGEKLTIRDWYYSAEGKYQLSEIRFADGTVWTKQDMNDIAAGTKQPFATPAETESFSPFGVASMSAARPSNWNLDPSLASIMNGPDISDAGSFAAAGLNMKIALASLNFGAATAEQICDVMNTSSAYANPMEVSVSTETGSKQSRLDSMKHRTNV